MRQSLMHTFDDIYLLDLHGNSKKKERVPDGGKDENVFDIQQGVAIGLFVKRGRIHESPAQVFHADLYGTRESKYAELAENDYSTTQWRKLSPKTSNYLFVPQDETVRAEYEQGWNIVEMMPVSCVGLYTARDQLTIHWDKEGTWQTVTDFIALLPEEAREKYKLGNDSQDWKVAFAQADLKFSGLTEDKLAPVLYRPFDVRHTYYTGKPSGFHCRSRSEMMHHFLNRKNLAICFIRRSRERLVSNFYVSNLVTDKTILSSADNANITPLYLYPTAKTDFFDSDSPSRTHGGRRPNLAPEFIADFSSRLKLDFVPDGCGDLASTFGPEDVFHYAYAVFHSPTYRRRYAQFLKMDFPRLPLTSNVEFFRSLCALGTELVALHLMEQHPTLQTRYPVAGDNSVASVRYTEPANGILGRVWINTTQYFNNVSPEVWGYHIGGYQVCQKWLKDRKGRQLSYDDLTHYQGIVAALSRTIELQARIDESIIEWPVH